MHKPTLIVVSEMLLAFKGRMRGTHNVFGVLVCLLAVSCTQMTSMHYVGQPVAAFEEFGKNVSIWKLDKNVYFVKPLDNYRAVVATLEWQKDQQEFKVEDHEIIVGELGKDRFLNLLDDGLYTIMRMAGSPDDFVIFPPNRAQLKQDVRSGRVTVKQPDQYTYEMVLSKEELDAYVMENADKLFRLNDAAVIEPVVPLKKSRSQ
tara:strand:+ start:254 stop:865 length:612 start_codon:yes stop_codon:yes gene_type:complete